MEEDSYLSWRGWGHTSVVTNNEGESLNHHGHENVVARTLLHSITLAQLCNEKLNDTLLFV